MALKLKVAAAQLAPVFLDRERTVDKACDAILEAGRRSIDLVAFPESFIPGYPYFAIALPPTRINDYLQRAYDQAVTIPGAATERLCEAARQARVNVVMGLHERDAGTLYNGQLVIDRDGRIVGKRRKLVPTSHERLVWGRGDAADLELFPMDFGKLGALVCYEHANALFRYALQGSGEQVHVANWPGGLPSINGIIDAATRHYAFEAQAFVISVTSVITAELLATLPEDVARQFALGGGHSAIIAPRGDILAGPMLDGEGLLEAELDFASIDRLKSIVDTAGHYARPDVVQLRLHPPRSPITREPR